MRIDEDAGWVLLFKYTNTQSVPQKVVVTLLKDILIFDAEKEFVLIVDVEEEVKYLNVEEENDLVDDLSASQGGGRTLPWRCGLCPPCRR